MAIPGWCHNLERHSDISRVVIYDRNMFKRLATGENKQCSLHQRFVLPSCNWLCPVCYFMTHRIERPFNIEAWSKSQRYYFFGFIHPYSCSIHLFVSIIHKLHLCIPSYTSWLHSFIHLCFICFEHKYFTIAHPLLLGIHLPVNLIYSFIQSSL